jgi:hypothetical protein
MGFANKRNFTSPLLTHRLRFRLTESADRRLEILSAISGRHEPISGDDQSPHTSKEPSIDDSPLAVKSPNLEVNLSLPVDSTRPQFGFH